jgi:hypothetical protein
MRSVGEGVVVLALLPIGAIYASMARMPPLAAMAATAAIAAADDRSQSESGIVGEVIIRPVRPHATIGQQNLEPYRATIEVIDADGRLVASIQSTLAGTFRIGLPPGTYTLRPQPPGPYPRASAQTVVVEPKSYTQVRIVYDSGIR